MKKTINDFVHFNIVDTVIIILISLIIYTIIKKLFAKGFKNNSLDKKMNNKSKTYIKLITSILKYVLLIITLLIVLQVNGINVSSMLAGVGIAGAVVGLAVQDALKDIIRGFSILSDEYFEVGDVISYDGITGKVLVLGLKSTKFQDLATGNVITVANRNIEKVTLVSHAIYINVPMPYELKLNEAEKIMQEIVEVNTKAKEIESIRYLGVNNFEDSYISYLIEVKCLPDKRLQVRRNTLKNILEVLEKHKISVPYNQLDVHMKKDI